MRRPAAPPPGGLALAGEQLFMSQQCVNCHTIDGTSATSKVGPNLTHMGSRATIGAGVLANTPAKMERWLANPQSIKPGTLMPDFKLTPAQVSELAAYLDSLK